MYNLTFFDKGTHQQLSRPQFHHLPERRRELTNRTTATTAATGTASMMSRISQCQSEKLPMWLHPFEVSSNLKCFSTG